MNTKKNTQIIRPLVLTLAAVATATSLAACGEASMNEKASMEKSLQMEDMKKDEMKKGDMKTSTHTREQAALLAATIAALGCAEALAALTVPEASPLARVGGIVIDHTPPVVKDLVISLAGTYDKVVRFVCMALGIAPLAWLRFLADAR